ncbi:HECT-domain-containing protein [Myriangium duriaei CBS 260.36]|uniref:HECT-type E3 ubiquitin transferase n=1 Tax=Myriangium duriaei CBS 260.36 TaxID=1168546 RepID=A0A9P4IWR0_9PEZI|nr:HECT-domain-containing protein [Myriangium duriaei CBS 260.36]
MPSPWPSRLLSGPITPPTVEPNHPTQGMRSSSKASNSLAPPADNTTPARTHSHNRSSSHPLPRIFVKRAGSFGWNKHADFDDQDDSDVGPVLDGLIGGSPSKKIGGKRIGDDEPAQVSFCMCCGQKSRFPKDSKTFRCTQCLTINDLQPYKPRPYGSDRHEVGSDEAHDGTLRAPPVERPILPLSVERTRAVIDFCLSTYLQTRINPKKLDSPIPEESSSYFQHRGSEPVSRPELMVRTSSSDVETQRTMEQHRETPSARTPGISPGIPEEPLSASIKSYADFDWSSYAPQPNRNKPSKDIDSPMVPTKSPVIARKPVGGPPARRPPAPPTPSTPAGAHSPLNLRSMPTGPIPHRPPGQITPEQRISHERYERAKKIFRPLEEYMHHNYGRFDSLNTSFSTFRPRITGRTHSESALRSPPPEPMDGSAPSPQDPFPQIDAKMLLLGDFAENGDWWTGRLERNISERVDRRKDKGAERRRGVTSRSACIDWQRLDRWYDTVMCPDRSWLDNFKRIIPDDQPDAKSNDLDPKLRADIELDLSIAREHAERALFKVTEQVLRRPGRPLTDPEDIRFLVLILSNPLLYPLHVQQRRLMATRGRSGRSGVRRSSNPSRHGRDPGQHAGILKRTLGLLAGSSDSCHRHLIGWFSRMPEGRYLDLLDLVSSFVSYRLSKRRARPKSSHLIDDGGLIPDFSGSAMQTSAQLQTAAGLSGGVRVNDDKEPGNTDYSEDWQLRAAARVMALLFAANNSWAKSERSLEVSPDEHHEQDARPRSKLYGQLLPISDFYNSILDYQDVIADFKTWESKKGKFSFCQYPFFLSMGAKMRILEYDARRQMETKARETYFNNVISGRAQNTHFNLNVRRDCVVEDSLQRISEVASQLTGDLKKGIRIHFTGEEGVDAGGLRKEWFLLLVRDIFDPNHGLFLYDDDSQLCYFNPNSFETSDQYYLVGVLLGLAIYNSTILDIALPPFAFRKLLAAAPSSITTTPLPGAGIKSIMTYTLDDLAEYRPSLAAGLRTLLDYEGDVESTYLWSFTVPTERYGIVTETPLIPGGENVPVTNANRHEFVSLYVRYILDTAVARQFEPFKRGFFTVCAGNALSLFRAEEIELLIRGSEQERIDVDALRAVAVYENFRDRRTGEVIKTDVESQVDVVRWWWEYFRDASAEEQRRLLQFVTASDRIPATGAAGLVLRVVGDGDGTGTAEGEDERFPVARTCFNLVTLWGWRSKEKLVEKVRGAVEGSEGFGLK